MGRTPSPENSPSRWVTVRRPPAAMMRLSGGPAGCGRKKRKSPPLSPSPPRTATPVRNRDPNRYGNLRRPPTAMTRVSGGPAGGGRKSNESPHSSPSPPRRATPQICTSDLQRALSREQGSPVTESLPISPTVNPPASVRGLPDGWPEGLPWELPIYPTKEEWAEAERETKMISRQLGIEESSSSEED